jgi:hypothetical protein
MTTTVYNRVYNEGLTAVTPAMFGDGDKAIWGGRESEILPPAGKNRQAGSWARKRTGTKTGPDLRK